MSSLLQTRNDHNDRYSTPRNAPNADAFSIEYDRDLDITTAECLLLRRVRAYGAARELAEDIGDVINRSSKHTHRSLATSIVSGSPTITGLEIHTSKGSRQHWGALWTAQRPWSCQSLSQGSRMNRGSHSSSMPFRARADPGTPLPRCGAPGLTRSP
jgi:hypothetical protein